MTTKKAPADDTASDGAREPARDDGKRPETAKPASTTRSRVEDFRKLAAAYARGACVMLPSALAGQARREHVRSTLREDHRDRIENKVREAEVKFDKLAASLFSFFRGTSLLFYRDIAGTDARMPTVLVLGDVHPSNFGVMPNADNVPIFGVNDFDETAYAPFTWDLKRGAVGFMIAAEEKTGFGRKTQRKIVRKFLEGYIEAMQHYADTSTEKREEFRMDNSPKVIRDLFAQTDRKRSEWLEDDYLDETGRAFRADDELTPISSRREEFQTLIDQLIKKNGIDPPARAGRMRVKDVAIRHGQGTASLGLPRYYVLIEGPNADATDDIIIEFKRARRSALEGLTPPSDFHAGDQGDRIAHGQSVQLAHGDIFFGSIEIDGVSFMTRERAPFRDDIDLKELSKKTWRHYARNCGRALAQAHALSDDAGEIDYDVEPAIMEAMTPTGLFVDDTIAFAEEAADRLRRDHAFFRADHALGAFDSVDRIYR